MRISDWSSDVCSSDLRIGKNHVASLHPAVRREWHRDPEHEPCIAAPLSQHAFHRYSTYEALVRGGDKTLRSEEHTSELQSLMRISYAVFCLKQKKNKHAHKYYRLPTH